MWYQKGAILSLRRPCFCGRYHQQTRRPVERYSIQLIWSNTENAYVATVPEIPRITLVAATAAEAVGQLQVAVSGYLKEKKERRETASAPRALEEYSGQFRLRLPRVLHAALVREAEAEGISLNSYLLYMLTNRYAQQQARQPGAALQFVKEECISS